MSRNSNLQADLPVVITIGDITTGPGFAPWIGTSSPFAALSDFDWSATPSDATGGSWVTRGFDGPADGARILPAAITAAYESMRLGIANAASYADVPPTPTLRVQSDQIASDAANVLVATTAAAASPTASIEQMANYLTTGYWRDTGQVPHAFDTSANNVLTVSLGGLTANDQRLARAALDSWAMVADVVFKEVSGSADLTFNDSKAGATTNVSYSSNGNTIGANINIGPDWAKEHGTKIGTYAYQTYIHEIGHALGLGHAGDYGSANGTRFANDTWQLSVMSYWPQRIVPEINSSEAYVTTAMMADIMAIQKLYGAAKGGETAGGTLYGVGSNLGIYLDDVFAGKEGSMAKNAMTIFDESGVDKIDFSDDTTKQKVDLNGGTYSNVYGLLGNLGIAAGTVIENYVGGSNGDKIIGNAAANDIKSMAGKDNVQSGDGNDIVKAGDGSDAAYGGNGRDALYGGNGDDTLYGGNDHDTLYGDAGLDALFGDSGNDSLFGGNQNDSVTGGAGNDILDGGEGNDVLRGGDGNDKMSGANGADMLDGGIGDDQLSGGGGADVFVFSAGRDVISAFADNADELRLDNALWANRSLTLDQALGYADVVNGNIVFDFGNGNTLTIQNMTNISSLIDDLIII